MRAIICLLGAATIALAALILGKSYAAFVRRRVSEYRSVLGFLDLMKREMTCYLRTPAELAERSSDDILEDSGFLEALKAEKGLAHAFSQALPRLHLSACDAEPLLSFFEKFGKGSLETELQSLELTTERFRARALAEEESASGMIRLARTLISLAALGIVILLL